jgi:hypothetical protein
LDNFKQNNGPHGQQFQYKRDVASGYPEPWKLWEYYGGKKWGKEFYIQCSYETNPSSTGVFALMLEYRRRSDADEMISEWERGQKVTSEISPWICKSCLDRSKQPDKCTTCESCREMLCLIEQLCSDLNAAHNELCK